MRATGTNAKSKPAVTAPPVMRLGSVTTRSFTVRAPIKGSRSATARCEVAPSPRSRPAAASTSDPVHTLVTHFARAPRSARKASTWSSCMQGTVPMIPPGTPSTSRSCALFSKRLSAAMGWPTSVASGRLSFQTSCMSKRAILKTVSGSSRSSATVCGYTGYRLEGLVHHMPEP